MTVIPSVCLSGLQAETASLPYGESLSVSLNLPGDRAEEANISVLSDPIINTRIPEPSALERLISHTDTLVAYKFQVKNQPVLKICSHEDIALRSLIKDIGNIRSFILHSPTHCEDEEADDVLGVLSVRSDGCLVLLVYDIAVEENGKPSYPFTALFLKCSIEHQLRFTEVLTDSYPDTSPPPLIQFQPTSTTNLVVAFGTKIFVVDGLSGGLHSLIDVPIVLKHPVVSIHIATDEEKTLAICTSDGRVHMWDTGRKTSQILTFLSFDSDAATQLIDIKLLSVAGEDRTDPIEVMDIVSSPDSDSEESPAARWICFPDDCSSDEDPWQSMIMASHSQLLVYSLAEWHTTYTVQIEFPHGFEPPPDLRYHLDKQAQILILSSSSLLYLYIFELHKTRGYKSPDVFKFVSCQPIQYKALDFVIMGCEKPDAIQGRYESSQFAYKIDLWVATSTGLYRWQIEIAPPSTFSPALPPVTTQLPADSPISSSTTSDVEEISPPAVPSLSELPLPNSTLPADFLLTLSQDLPKLVPNSPDLLFPFLVLLIPILSAEPSMVGLLVLLDDVIVDIERVTEYVCKLLDRGIENSTNIAQNIIIDMYSNKVRALICLLGLRDKLTYRSKSEKPLLREKSLLWENYPAMGNI
eukprot:sb/3462925/